MISDHTCMFLLGGLVVHRTDVTTENILLNVSLGGIRLIKMVCKIDNLKKFLNTLTNKY